MKGRRHSPTLHTRVTRNAPHHTGAAQSPAGRAPSRVVPARPGSFSLAGLPPSDSPGPVRTPVSHKPPGLACPCGGLSAVPWPLGRASLSFTGGHACRGGRPLPFPPTCRTSCSGASSSSPSLPRRRRPACGCRRVAGTRPSEEAVGVPCGVPSACPPVNTQTPRPKGNNLHTDGALGCLKSRNPTLRE